MEKLIRIFNKYYEIILLTFLIIFYEINNYNWLRLDSQPPEWLDQVWYLFQSLSIYDAVNTYSIDTLIYFTSGYHPPLVYLLVIPSYFIAGASTDVAILTNILYYAILILSIYGIAYRISNKKEIGLLSAFIISTFPMIFGMSRLFLMDFPLTAMVSLSIYFLFCTEHFKNRTYSILFGISMALGLLIKPGYPFFIILPFLYIIRNDIKIIKIVSGSKQLVSELKLRKSIHNILYSITIAIFLASFWYIPNFKAILKLQSWNRDIYAMNQNKFLNLESVLFYPVGIINYEISFFYFLIFFILIVITFNRFVQNKSIKNLFRNLNFENYIILAFWIIIPYLIFTFYYPLEFRYLLPSTPAIAIAISLMVDKIPNKTTKLLVFLVILLCGSTQFFIMTYGSSTLPKEIALDMMMQRPVDKLILFSQEYRYDYPGRWGESWTYLPKKVDWKINDILNIISDDSVKTTPKIMIIPHIERFNLGTFWYYKSLYKKNMIFSDFDSLQVKEDIENFDYIILKDHNNCGVVYLCNDINKSYSIFINSSKNFTLIKSFPLPDSSNVWIYRKNIQFANG